MAPSKGGRHRGSCAFMHRSWLEWRAWGLVMMVREDWKKVVVVTGWTVEVQSCHLWLSYAKFVCHSQSCVWRVSCCDQVTKCWVIWDGLAEQIQPKLNFKLNLKSGSQQSLPPTTSASATNSNHILPPSTTSNWQTGPLASKRQTA